jgi:universal stress protein A
MREYKKILLAVDVTEGSEQIAERARDIAARYGAEVIMLHVVEYVPVEPMGEALLPAVQIEGELIERATRRIAELAQKVGLERPSASCRPATSRPSWCVSQPIVAST